MEDDIDDMIGERIFSKHQLIQSECCNCKGSVGFVASFLKKRVPACIYIELKYNNNAYSTNGTIGQHEKVLAK